jgi:hypothetical protein
MPHPTAPSGEKVAIGPSYFGEGLNSQTTKAEFKTSEYPLIGTPLSSAAKPTEVRSPQHVTPPQSPIRSPLCKPSAHQAIPNTLSPPLTPESQRYPKALAISSRDKKAGSSDSWRGITERLGEEVSVGELKVVYYDSETSGIANEEVRNHVNLSC